MLGKGSRLEGSRVAILNRVFVLLFDGDGLWNGEKALALDKGVSLLKREREGRNEGRYLVNERKT